MGLFIVLCDFLCISLFILRELPLIFVPMETDGILLPSFNLRNLIEDDCLMSLDVCSLMIFKKHFKKKHGCSFDFLIVQVLWKTRDHLYLVENVKQEK